MTAVEIIEETVAFYSEDPTRRAANDKGGCNYKTEDGRKCALGRNIRGNVEKSVWGCLGWAAQMARRVGGSLDNVLKKKYHGHPVSFWSDLQKLHDMDRHWGEEGLTHEGRRFAKWIRKEWAS